MKKPKTIKRKPAKPEKRTGRPSKLTPELSKFICDRIAIGCTIENSANAAGISVRMIYHWRDLGKSDSEDGKESRYSQFYQDFTRAKGQSEVSLVSDLKKSAQGYDIDYEEETYENGILVKRVTKKKHVPRDPKAAIFLLSNRFPSLWSNQHKVELSGGVDVKGTRERLSPLLSDPKAIAAADTLAECMTAAMPDTGEDD